MKVKVLDIELERKEVTIRKDEFKKFKMYLSKGFYVFNRDNGLNTLRTKSKIWVTVEYNPSEFERIDLKPQLVKCYGKMDGEKLIARFRQDLDEHRASLKVDSNGNYYISRK